eukprot:gene4285-7621_t
MDSSLLTDKQVQQFICDGFLIIKSTFSEEFHKDLYKEALNLHEREGNNGNNIYPKVLNLLKVYQDKPVVDALESLLGNNYIMQPHRHPHLNRPGSKFQQWHKDSFFGFTKPARHHHITNLMGFYYPQKTTIKMAPTEIKPQTQYSMIDPRNRVIKLDNKHRKVDKEKDIIFTCEAGTILIIHYDLVHRGTSNKSSNDRFMFKFQFSRTEFPLKPTWNSQNLIWKTPINMNPLFERIGEHVWNWMCGNEVNIKKINIDHKIISKLDAKDEDERLFANYEIAQSEDFELLFKRLSNSQIQYALNSAYALVSSGVHGMKYLIEGLNDKSVTVQYLSCYILSEIGVPAKDSIPNLLTLLKAKNQKHSEKNSHFVRLYIMEAFGNFEVSSKEVIDALCYHLLQINESNDMVRYSSAMSLIKLCDESSIEYLEKSLNDDCRYVREYSLIALQRIGTKVSLKIFQDYRDKHKNLDPLTTKDSQY